jgi:CHAD domain-containing protein
VDRGCYSSSTGDVEDRKMASVTTLPSASTEHRGLDYWMQRVIAELGKLRHSQDKDTVHDLRVAIRRCRSVGAVMAEVDPNAMWREMRHVPRKLFRRLGMLRDAQIIGDWVKTHGAENDKLRIILQEHFASQEPDLMEAVVRAAEKFDEKAWKKLGRKLAKRVRLVAPGSLAAECLALERLEEGKALNTKAMREPQPESWHALRIGIKKFRYTVESLLPARYEEWSRDLKQLQDTLGEVHDLDVLTELVQEKAETGAPETLMEWEGRIERERNRCLDQYNDLAAGKGSIWNVWTQALPQGQRAMAAGTARIRATARAAEGRVGRGEQGFGIAAAILDAFRYARVAPLFRERSSRRMLRAVARLSGASGKRSLVSRKELSRFLICSPVPPGWTKEEWEVLAWSLRYHRGKEPQAKNGGWNKLTTEQQQELRAWAGVLRLARGLRKCGVENGMGFRAERTVDAVHLEVPGLSDSAEHAARLAAAKHLLESYLQVPLILRAAGESVSKIPVRRVGPRPAQPQTFAEASD